MLLLKVAKSDFKNYLFGIFNKSKIINNIKILFNKNKILFIPNKI